MTNRLPASPSAVDSDVLVHAEHVSKKFCRSLKRSLVYGVQDVAAALNPWGNGADGRADGRMMPLRRDEFWAVQDVSFELRRGECLGLIGHNGAGKSTLLKMLNGLIPPDTGRITTRGRVAALIELNAGFNPVLSGRENIYNQAALLGFSPLETRAKFDEIVGFAEIDEFIDMPVQNYSSGMRVRLGFAVAMQMEPDILIVDEVLAVGDVSFRMKCLNAVADMMSRAAVVFVSHSMPEVIRICNEVILLDHGFAAFQGQPVAEGVNRYLALNTNSAGSVLGSGEVEVSAIALDSPNAHVGLGETLHLDYGDSLRLEASLRAADYIDQVRIEFLFWNAEMLPVLEIVTDELAGFASSVGADGAVVVSAQIPAVILNAGRYSLSVIVTSPDQQFMRVLCRHDNVAFLQVTADSPSGSYMLATATWSVSMSSVSR